MFQPSCILLYFIDIFLVLFQLSLCFSGHHTVISKVTGPVVGGGGGEGYSWELMVGVCRPVLRILTLFQTKKISLFTPVYRLACRK